jgi:hypothetical protein
MSIHATHPPSHNTHTHTHTHTHMHRYDGKNYSPLMKLIIAVTSFLSVGIFSIPVSILAWGFEEEVCQQERVDLCVCVCLVYWLYFMTHVKKNHTHTTPIHTSHNTNTHTHAGRASPHATQKEEGGTAKSPQLGPQVCCAYVGGCNVIGIDFS